MYNAQKNKTLDKELEPEIRNKNFEEVSLGYTESEAVNEANRCLNCKNPPCVKNCPVNVLIPEFISLVKEGKFIEGYLKIKETNYLPAVCGRVCPQETQCEAKCIRGIKDEPVGIGKLERFCADWFLKNSKTEKNEKKASNNIKIAVLGSGPAGLTCAGDLNNLGYEVTIFEALHEAGGVLTYGIPEFRLPKKIVKTEIDKLIKSGVKLEKNVVIGKTLGLEDLFKDGFRAVFIGTGAGLPQFLGIEGENLNSVFSANEYLTRINLMKGYLNNSLTPVFDAKKIVVVGGGNVAMDAARCAKRMGADVKIVYRRSLDEMPARREEVKHAEEEGIEFLTLTNPVKILGENSFVKKIECVKMELGEIDKSGRRSVKEIKGSNFEIETDCVIIAVGTSPNPILKSSAKNLEVNSKGCIIADESGKTSVENVYAGGDAVSGAATVILAMGAGKAAAKAINEKIKLNC